MKKIIIATHHKLAKGFKETLNYIAPNTVEVLSINAYVDDTELSEQIDEALSHFQNNDQILVFTDLLGGSVNQEFTKRIGNKNIKIITGVNLPALLTISLNLSMRDISDEDILNYINESREQLVFVNDYLKNTMLFDDEDE